VRPLLTAFVALNKRGALRSLGSIVSRGAALCSVVSTASAFGIFDIFPLMRGAAHPRCGVSG
jgi:hypothetical protein